MFCEDHKLAMKYSVFNKTWSCDLCCGGGGGIVSKSNCETMVGVRKSDLEKWYKDTEFYKNQAVNIREDIEKYLKG